MAKPAILAAATPAADGPAKKKGFSLLNKTKATVVSRNLIPFSRRKVAKPLSDKMSLTVQAPPPPILSVSFASGGSPNHPGKAVTSEDSSDASHSHGSSNNNHNNGNISDDTKISSLTDRDGLNYAADKRQRQAQDAARSAAVIAKIEAIDAAAAAADESGDHNTSRGSGDTSSNDRSSDFSYSKVAGEKTIVVVKQQPPKQQQPPPPVIAGSDQQQRPAAIDAASSTRSNSTSSNASSDTSSSSSSSSSTTTSSDIDNENKESETDSSPLVDPANKKISFEKVKALLNRVNPRGVPVPTVDTTRASSTSPTTSNFQTPRVNNTHTALNHHHHHYSMRPRRDPTPTADILKANPSGVKAPNSSPGSLALLSPGQLLVSASSPGGTTGSSLSPVQRESSDVLRSLSPEMRESPRTSSPLAMIMDHSHRGAPVDAPSDIVAASRSDRLSPPKSNNNNMSLAFDDSNHGLAIPPLSPSKQQDSPIVKSIKKREEENVLSSSTSLSLVNLVQTTVQPPVGEETTAHLKTIVTIGSQLVSSDDDEEKDLYSSEPVSPKNNAAIEALDSWSEWFRATLINPKSKEDDSENNTANEEDDENMMRELQKTNSRGAPLDDKNLIVVRNTNNPKAGSMRDRIMKSSVAARAASSFAGDAKNTPPFLKTNNNPFEEEEEDPSISIESAALNALDDDEVAAETTKSVGLVPALPRKSTNPFSPQNVGKYDETEEDDDDDARLHPFESLGGPELLGEKRSTLGTNPFDPLVVEEEVASTEADWSKMSSTEAGWSKMSSTEAEWSKLSSVSESQLQKLCGVNPFDGVNEVSKSSPRKLPVVTNPFDRMALPAPLKTNPFDDAIEAKNTEGGRLPVDDGDESSDDGIPVPVVDAELMIVALEKTLTGLIPSSNPGISPRRKGNDHQKKRGEPLTETNAIQAAVNTKATAMAEKHVANTKLSAEEARALARQAIDRTKQRKKDLQPKKSGQGESQQDQRRPRKKMDGHSWLPGEISLSKDDSVSEFGHSLQNVPMQHLDSPASRANSGLGLYDIEEVDRYATVESTPLEGVQSFESDAIIGRDRYAPINEAPTMNDTPEVEAPAQDSPQRANDAPLRIEETTPTLVPKEDSQVEKESILDEVSEWTTDSPEAGGKAIEIVLKGSNVVNKEWSNEPFKENHGSVDLDSFDEALNLVLGEPSAMMRTDGSGQCDPPDEDISSLALSKAESVSVSGVGFELTVSEHLQALAHRITTSAIQKPLEAIKEPSTGKTVNLFRDNDDEVSQGSSGSPVIASAPFHVQALEKKPAEDIYAIGTSDIPQVPISSSGTSSPNPATSLGFFSTTPHTEKRVEQNEDNEILNTARPTKLQTKKPSPPEARHEQPAQKDRYTRKATTSPSFGCPRSPSSSSKKVPKAYARARPTKLSIAPSVDSSFDDGRDIFQREPSGLEVITANSFPLMSTVPVLQDPVGRSPLDLRQLRPDPDEHSISQGSTDSTRSSENQHAPEACPGPPPTSHVEDLHAKQGIASLLDNSTQASDVSNSDNILNDTSAIQRSRAVEMEELVLTLRSQGMKPSKVKKILAFGEHAASLSPKSRSELENRMDRLNPDSKKILKKSITLAKSNPKEKKRSEKKKSSEPELIDLTSIDTIDDLDGYAAVWLFDLSPKESASKGASSADMDSVIDQATERQGEGAGHFFRADQQSDDPTTLDTVIEFASKMSETPASPHRVSPDKMKSEHEPVPGSPTRAVPLAIPYKETRDSETQVGKTALRSDVGSTTPLVTMAVPKKTTRDTDNKASKFVAPDASKVNGDGDQVLGGGNGDAPQTSDTVHNAPTAAGESTGDVLVVVQGTDVVSVPVPVLQFPRATDAQPLQAHIMMGNPYDLAFGSIQDPWTYHGVLHSDSHGFARANYEQHAPFRSLDSRVGEHGPRVLPHAPFKLKKANIDAPSNHHDLAVNEQEAAESARVHSSREKNARNFKGRGAPFPGRAQANTVLQNFTAPTPELRGSTAVNIKPKKSSQASPGDQEEPIYYSKRVGRDTVADDDIDFCDVLGEVIQSFDITDNFKAIENERKPFSQALGAISPSHSSTSNEDPTFPQNISSHRRPTPERSREPNTRRLGKDQLSSAPLMFHGARKNRPSQAQNDQQFFDYVTDEFLRPGILALQQALSGEQEQRPSATKGLDQNRQENQLIRKRPTPEDNMMRSRQAVGESTQNQVPLRRTYSIGEEPVDASSVSGSGPTFSIGEDPIGDNEKLACDTRIIPNTHSFEADSPSGVLDRSGRESAAKLDASPGGAAFTPKSKLDASPCGAAWTNVLEKKAVDPEPILRSQVKAMDPEPTEPHAITVDPLPADTDSGHQCAYPEGSKPMNPPNIGPAISETSTDNENDLIAPCKKLSRTETTNAATSDSMKTPREDVKPQLAPISSPATSPKPTSPKARSMTISQLSTFVQGDVKAVTSAPIAADNHDAECPVEVTTWKATDGDVKPKNIDNAPMGELVTTDEEPVSSKETRVEEPNDTTVPTAQKDLIVDNQMGSATSTTSALATSESIVKITIEELKPGMASGGTTSKLHSAAASPSASDLVVKHDFLDVFFEGAEFMVCGVRDRRNHQAFNNVAGRTAKNNSPATKQSTVMVDLAGVNESKDRLDLNAASDKDLLDRYGEAVERAICYGPTELGANQTPTTLLAVQKELIDRYGEAIDHQPTPSNDSGVVVHETTHIGVQTDEPFPFGISSGNGNLNLVVAAPKSNCASHSRDPHPGPSGDENVQTSVTHDSDRPPPPPLLPRPISPLHESNAPPPPPPSSESVMNASILPAVTPSCIGVAAQAVERKETESSDSASHNRRVPSLANHPISKDLNATEATEVEPVQALEKNSGSKPPIHKQRHSIQNITDSVSVQESRVGAIPERPFLASSHGKTAAPVPEQRLMRNKALMDLADSASNVALSMAASEDSVDVALSMAASEDFVAEDPAHDISNTNTKKMIHTVKSIPQRETIEVAFGGPPQMCNTNMSEGEAAKGVPVGIKDNAHTASKSIPEIDVGSEKNEPGVDDAVRVTDTGFASEDGASFVVVERELVLAATCSDDVTLLLQVDDTTGEPYLAPVEKVSSGIQKEDSRDAENDNQSVLRALSNALSSTFLRSAESGGESLESKEDIGATCSSSSSVPKHQGSNAEGFGSRKETDDPVLNKRLQQPSEYSMLEPIKAIVCSQGTQTVNDRGTQTMLDTPVEMDEGIKIAASAATAHRDILIKTLGKQKTTSWETVATPSSELHAANRDLALNQNPVNSEATDESEFEFADAEKVVSEILAMNKVVTEMLAIKSLSPRAAKEMNMQLKFESGDKEVNQDFDNDDNVAESHVVDSRNEKADGVSMYHAGSTSASKSTPRSESDSESRLFQSLHKSMSMADGSAESRFDAVIHVNSRCESEVIEMNIVSDSGNEHVQFSNSSGLPRDAMQFDGAIKSVGSNFSAQDVKIMNTRSSSDASAPRPEFASKHASQREKGAGTQRISPRRHDIIYKTQSEGIANHGETFKEKIVKTRSAEMSCPRPGSMSKQTRGEKSAVLQKLSGRHYPGIATTQSDGMMNLLENSLSAQDRNTIKTARSADVSGPCPESMCKKSSKRGRFAVLSKKRSDGIIKCVENMIEADRAISKTKSVEATISRSAISEPIERPTQTTKASLMEDIEAPTAEDNEIARRVCSIVSAASSEVIQQESPMGHTDERVSYLSETDDAEENSEAWNELQHRLLRLSLSAPEQSTAREDRAGLFPLETAAAEASALSSLSFNAAEPGLRGAFNFCHTNSDPGASAASELHNQRSDFSSGSRETTEVGGSSSPKVSTEVSGAAVFSTNATEGHASDVASCMMANNTISTEEIPAISSAKCVTSETAESLGITNTRMADESAKVEDAIVVVSETASDLVSSRADPPSGRVTPILPLVRRGMDPPSIEGAPTLDTVMLSTVLSMMTTTDDDTAQISRRSNQSMDNSSTEGGAEPKELIDEQEKYEPEQTMEGVEVTVDSFVQQSDDEDAALPRPSVEDEKRTSDDSTLKKVLSLRGAIDHAAIASLANATTTGGNEKKLSVSDQIQEHIADPEQEKFDEMAKDLAAWHRVPSIGEDAKKYMVAASAGEPKVYLVLGNAYAESTDDESKKLLASAGAGLTQALGPPVLPTDFAQLPHENSKESAKDTNETTSSIDHSHDETRTSTQIAESSVNSATDNSHDYSTSVTYSKASHVPIGGGTPSILHRRLSSYTGTSPFCFAGLPQLFQPPKVQKASSAIEEAERSDESSSRSIPSPGLRVVNHSRKGTPADMDLEVVQVQPRKDSWSPSSKQEPETFQRRVQEPIPDVITSTSQMSKTESHAKSKSSRPSQSSRKSKAFNVASHNITSIPQEIDVQPGSSQPSVKTLTPTSISSASSPAESRSSGEQKISRFGSDIGDAAISGPPSRSTASAARSCAHSLGPISEGSPSDAQLSPSSERVASFNRTKDDDSSLLLALTRSEAEPTLALSSGTSGGSQADASSTTENDKLHIDPALWGSIAMSDQDSTSSSPHKEFLASRERSSKDVYKRTSAGDTLISNAERADLLSRVEKVRAMVASPRIEAAASPRSEDSSYGYTTHQSSHDSQGSHQSSHASQKLHRASARSAESSTPGARPLSPSRGFVRSTRLQTVLDRLRNRQPLRISDSHSVSSSEVENVDVDELFSRYDEIVKHMVVTDKERLERVKERQAAENQKIESDEDSQATENHKADSAYQRKSSPMRLKTSSRKSQKDASYRGSPIIDVTALGSASHDTTSEIGHKPASLKRRNSFGSASEQSATPSEKARELRRQLDQALRTSVAIRTTQERLNSEISSFKSRLQQQRSAIPGTDSCSISISEGRLTSASSVRGGEYSFDTSSRFSAEPSSSRYSPANAHPSHGALSSSEGRSLAISPCAHSSYAQASYRSSVAAWDADNCIVIDDVVPTFQAAFMPSGTQHHPQYHHHQQHHHHQLHQQQQRAQNISPLNRSMIDGLQEQDENSASSTDDEETIRLRQLDSIIHGLQSAQRF